MNQIDLRDKIAVVTGAARGIGFAIASRLLASGASCALWDADGPALRLAEEKLAAPGRTRGTAVDITDLAGVTAAAEAATAHFGGIDILVNNAGVAGASRKLWECPPAEWQRVIQINLLGVFHCCHAVVPVMLRKNYGRIVNVASIAGKEGNPNASHYSAAKAGVIGLTKSLGKELAHSGLRVNCVTPAVIRTEILQQLSAEHIKYMLARIPVGRAGEPEEVAALVAWLCSAECSFSTGATFDLSGGRATY